MNEQDLRVIKSKKAIRDALFSILASKPINKITIKEISETAGINGKTFYTHYDSIEDLSLIHICFCFQGGERICCGEL